MFGFNKVILAGNLVRDPELRRANNGDVCTEFRFAVDESHRTRSGDISKRTLFIDVITWGPQAESSHRYLSQGSRAIIEGRLENKEWRNAEGQTRSIIRVNATTIQFLDPPRNNGENSRSEHKGAAAAQETTWDVPRSSTDIPF